MSIMTDDMYLSLVGGTACPDFTSGTKQSIDYMRIMKLYFLNLMTLPVRDGIF